MCVFLILSISFHYALYYNYFTTLFQTYIKQLSTALRFEYSKHNITIQHLSPYFINTKMNDFSGRLRQTSLFVPDADMYARYAIETLGKVDHSTGYWSHGPQVRNNIFLNKLTAKTYLHKLLTQVNPFIPKYISKIYLVVGL